MLFTLGQVVITANCNNYIQQHLINPWDLISRHQNGDYGDLCQEDKNLNTQSLVPGNEGRIFSAYIIDGTKFYVITEWDRSYTTLMLDSDY